MIASKWKKRVFKFFLLDSLLVMMEQIDGRCTDNITGWDPQRVTDQQRSEPEQQRGINGSVRQLITYVVKHFKHFISKEIRYQQLSSNNGGDTTYQCSVISNTRRPVMMIRTTSLHRNHSHNDGENVVNKSLCVLLLYIVGMKVPRHDKWTLMSGSTIGGSHVYQMTPLSGNNTSEETKWCWKVLMHTTSIKNSTKLQVQFKKKFGSLQLISRWVGIRRVYF